MTRLPIALENRNQDGAKLFSPSAGRNKAVIAEALAPRLPQDATILEVGSGTGEHGAAIGALRPDISWQYSDPDEKSRLSQQAWALPHWPAPLTLDMCADQWWADLPSCNAMFSANMIHIAPVEALLGLAKGAGQLTGVIFLYGPFLLEADSAPSNQEFDRSLKSRNPQWGVRELAFVKHIFGEGGFNLAESLTMPRNNLLLEFRR
jgi:hypothetical protein